MLHDDDGKAVGDLFDRNNGISFFSFICRLAVVIIVLIDGKSVETVKGFDRPAVPNQLRLLSPRSVTVWDRRTENLSAAHEHKDLIAQLPFIFAELMIQLTGPKLCRSSWIIYKSIRFVKTKSAMKKSFFFIAITLWSRRQWLVMRALATFHGWVSINCNPTLSIKYIFGKNFFYRFLKTKQSFD